MNPEQRTTTLATLSPSAVLSYCHLNLHGEYNSSDRLLLAEAPFDMDLIAAWQPLMKATQSGVGGFILFV